MLSNRIDSGEVMAILGSIIKKMLNDDIVVIASGGGGMPVFEKEGWGLDGIEAVIDKDLASERLAEAVEAELLMILTNNMVSFLEWQLISITSTILEL